MPSTDPRGKHLGLASDVILILPKADDDDNNELLPLLSSNLDDSNASSILGDTCIGCSDFLCCFPKSNGFSMTSPSREKLTNNRFSWPSNLFQMNSNSSLESNNSTTCKNNDPNSKGSDECIQVYINGRLVPELAMYEDYTSNRNSVGSEFCLFLHGGALRPHIKILHGLVENKVIHLGCNTIRYVKNDSMNGNDVATCYAESQLFLWNVHDRIVISDIDGTVTRSDASSVMDTILTKNYSNHSEKDDTIGTAKSVAHRGICRFFSHIAHQNNDIDEGYCVRFVYLTSRPISLMNSTRDLINSLRQEGIGLPQGPIICRSTASWTKVLMHEIVHRNSDEFKADAISRQVILPFAAAGRKSSDQLFIAGFGNRPTDGKAYEMAGLAREDIFIINSSSVIATYVSLTHDQISHNVCDGAFQTLTEGCCNADYDKLSLSNSIIELDIDKANQTDIPSQHLTHTFRSYDDPRLMATVMSRILSRMEKKK